MLQQLLPAPTGQGVYTFPDDLKRAHLGHLASLDARRIDEDTTIIDLTAPHSGLRYPIAQRQPYGRRVIALEPHQDDVALSASGWLLSHPVPLTVITVFTRSAFVDPTLKDRYPTEEAVSQIRARENREALRPLQADQYLLGHKDADAPFRPFDSARLERITDELREIVAQCPDAELIAPAGVTKHPDHLLVHEAARRIGCCLFWEDSAFWTIYALSTDDRHLFDMRVGNSFVSELVDITDVVLDKLTLLHMHGTQVASPADLHVPVRYSWTTAAELPKRQQAPDAACFAERLYRLKKE